MNSRQKKILVPIDFSPSAESALKVAANFAAMHGSELVLLHVVEPVAPMAEFFTDEDLMERKRNMSNTLLDKLIDHHKDLNVDMAKLMKEGKPYRSIIKAAEELMVEMIVMGTWGTHAIESGTIGSNVNKVVRTAKRPVVTVTRPPQHVEISRLLVAVDPSFGVQELKEFLKRYSDVYNPTVELVSIATREEEVKDLEANLSKQKEYLEKNGIKDVSFTVKQGYLISDALLELAETGVYDMIWMETHGRKGIAAWIWGSVTEEVILHSPIPVLSIRPDRDAVRQATYYQPGLPI